MRVSAIINVLNQYNSYKDSLSRDKRDLLEYQLFDSHFGINGQRMHELERRIKQTEQNMNDLLNSDIEEMSGINIVG